MPKGQYLDFTDRKVVCQDGDSLIAILEDIMDSICMYAI